MLVLRNVAKRVLVDVNLTVRPGQVVAITGGNGSGKSTLLKIIAGVSRPASGTVRGRPHRIGYVPERFAAHQRMTARAYLAHLGRIRGLSTVVARARADALLARLSFVDGGSLRRLSKGNAQKVALAQALLVPPHLLVLDEPWSGLDATAHEVLAELIDEVADRGGAVVFTDHREAVVDGIATDRYHIVEGRVRR